MESKVQEMGVSSVVKYILFPVLCPVPAACSIPGKLADLRPAHFFPPVAKLYLENTPNSFPPSAKIADCKV